MEMPALVMVHNADLGLKGTQAELLRVSEKGFYELNIPFGDNEHRVLLPVAGTVIILREAEIEFQTEVEVER